jgi:hypothetical protein
MSSLKSQPSDLNGQNSMTSAVKVRLDSQLKVTGLTNMWHSVKSSKGIEPQISDRMHQVRGDLAGPSIRSPLLFSVPTRGAYISIRQVRLDALALHPFASTCRLSETDRTRRTSQASVRSPVSGRPCSSWPDSVLRL